MFIKNSFILFFILLLINSCSVSEAKKEFANEKCIIGNEVRFDKIQIITVDNCEYIVFVEGEAHNFTTVVHKGNCVNHSPKN